MNEELKAMLEQLKTLQTEVRSANEAGEKVETLTAQIDELRGQIDTMSAAANRPNIGGGEVVDAEVEKRAQAFDGYVRKGDMVEVRALDGSTDEDGGVFLTPDLDKRIRSAASNMNEIRKHCYVGTTGRDSVNLTVLSGVTAGYGTITPSPQDLKSAKIRFEVQDCKALAVIPENTLNDSEYDVDGKLESEFAKKLSEAEAKAMANGDGVDKPKGIVCTSTKANAITSESTGSLGATGEDIEDIINSALYKLNKTYRKNAKLLCNSNTESVLAKVRDGNGNRLLTKSGETSYFNGIEIVTNEYLDDIAAGKFPIVVGDLRQYEVYDRTGISVKRLTGGDYDTSSNVGFLLKARHAGGVAMAEAFVPIKIKSA